ncbi:UNVERIFIED_CONTAM: hypothetical protein GTU68_065528 [Idotea baltica]|nr:hypothetical protein [Idotea baltica]
MKNIAVFTSGGDAPGMNAAIRAVVRSAIFYGKAIYGIQQGYYGMINNTINEMNARSVSSIINRGGTILKSARSEEFKTDSGMAKAFHNIKQKNIDAIVAIGGDGTFRGADAFSKKYEIPIVGIPGTIDNDLAGTDFTLGFDTSTNTAMRLIDTIRDTATSHNRLFFIEVMGRDTGYIAVRSALASGAEAALIPEKTSDIKELCESLMDGAKRKKSSSIVVVAEGDEAGGAFAIAEKVRTQFPDYEIKVTVLGHLQRGGSPTCFDRELGSRLGVAAIEGLLNGHKNEMLGIVNNELRYTAFGELHHSTKGINEELIRINKILSI